MIAGPMELTKRDQLSHATIATLARMMIEMLNWVVNRFSDLAVQAAGHKALTSMQGIEKMHPKRSGDDEEKKVPRKGNLHCATQYVKKAYIESTHEDAGCGAMRVSRIETCEEQKKHAKDRCKFRRHSTFFIPHRTPSSFPM